MKAQVQLAPTPEHRLDIALIPYGELTGLLPKLIKYLKTAAAFTQGRSCVDDIVRAIFMGHYSLWVAFDIDTTDMVGFFALEVKQYPQRRMLVIQHCVMDTGSLKVLEPRMQELATRYAKDVGCSGIEFVGRPGWKRYSKRQKYHSHSVVYQKLFEVEEK